MKHHTVLAALLVLGACDQPESGGPIKVMEDAAVIEISAAIENGALELYAGGDRFAHRDDAIINELSHGDAVSIPVTLPDTAGGYRLLGYTVTPDGEMDPWAGGTVIEVPADADAQMRFVVVATRRDGLLARDPWIIITRKKNPT